MTKTLSTNLKAFVACLSLWPAAVLAGSPDPVANLLACKQGSPSCDRSRLSLAELGDVARADHARDVADCRNGRAACDLSRLSPAEADALTETDDNYREMHFARAFAYEKRRLFWKAVAEYDRILSRSPGNRVATKLRLRALSDLRVSAFALEQAAAVLPRDEDLHNSLKDDVANKHIGWQEPDKAVGILAPLSTIKDATRYRYDYLAALHVNDDMEYVVREYEALLRDGIVPPPWVMEMAASAFLYLEQAHKALEIYEQALEKNPRSVNGRKGKFYTLQELRRWQNAGEVLDDLDREQPELSITCR